MSYERNPLKLALWFVKGVALGVVLFGGCAMHVAKAGEIHFLPPEVHRAPPQSVPEPEGLAVLATAVAALLVARRRRK